MANFFPRWTNGLPLKVTACVGVVALASGAGAAYYFTQKYTRVGYRPVQPVSFSHAVHAGQLGMDCRYCHGFADVAAQANIPTTQSCMACHAQIRAASPKLEALWESGKTGRPVEWVRVHQVPDYASFKPVRIRRRDRQPGKEHCAEYRLDKPKSWLLSVADLATLENQGVA